MRTKNYYSVFLIITIYFTHDLLLAQWIQKKSMPTPRTVLSVETVNGKIYAIGGYDVISALPTVEEYDPATDSWTRKKNMPTKRGYLSSSAVNGEIISIGGYEFSERGEVEKYNPQTNEWVTLTDLPAKRWGHGACTVNGKIYIIGGAKGWPARHVGKVLEYDPSTDSWSDKTSIPTERWLLACCVFDGKIYAIGGMEVADASAVVEMYDPTTDSWTSKSTMPTARWGLSAGVVNGKIYAIGGVDDDPPNICYNIVEIYDPNTDTWTTGNPLPVERGGLSSHSVIIDGWLYVVGGGGMSTSDVYSEVFALDLATQVEVNILKPNEYSLEQNYPNPFNPNTKINYSIPEQSYVTLKVFDVLGREVATLVNKERPVGNYEVEFDASALTSGIYFYRIESGDFIETKKMVLMK